MNALTEAEEHTDTARACAVLGLSRASVYRWRAPKVAGPAPVPARRAGPAWSLDARERDAVLAELTSDRFADKAPEQIWAILLDEGRYLASVSTMYRLLRAEVGVRDRRAQATHPPRKHPRLIADGPDQVWSWDITKLKTPTKGTYFDLYAVMDIYSRKMMNWEVHARESGRLAKDFLDTAIASNGGIMPGVVHSDNGTSMTSKDVADLLAELAITRSHSRPKVSNDNPFSEAAFKTLKYCPVFPDYFDSLPHARAFTDDFFVYYNEHHRHSGIGLYTPSSVHDGSWKYVRDTRQETLDAAFTTHPDRFRRKPPKAPVVPATVWINKPPRKIESNDDPHTTSTT